MKTNKEKRKTNKTRRLTVRCKSADELALWHQIAAERGFSSTSAYVRSVLNKAIKKPLPGYIPYGGRLTDADMRLKEFKAVGARLNGAVKIANLNARLDMRRTGGTLDKPLADLIRLMRIQLDVLKNRDG